MTTSSASPLSWQARWSIAAYRGPRLDALDPASPCLTPAAVTDVRAIAVATPFAVRLDHRWHLFFEVMDGDRRLREIGHATSTEGERWDYDAIVLRRDHDVSFPQIVTTENDVFMLLTAADEGLDLCVADRFPSGWRTVTRLLAGPYRNATVRQHEGRWYLWAQRGLDELTLFTSPALDGNWQPHPASPIVAGNRRLSRPAGPISTIDGRVYRFAQDQWPTEGAAVRALEIVELSARAYDEREASDRPILTPGRTGWNAHGMHHCHVLGRRSEGLVALVDGCALALA